MYILWVQIDVKPEHRAAFAAAMAAHAHRATENEPGTIRFEVIADASDPNRLYFFEGYVDEAAFEAHGKRESIAQFREETKGMADATVVSRGTTLFPPDDGAYRRQ